MVMKEMYPSKACVAVDNCFERLEILKDRLQKRGLWDDNVKLIHQDWEKDWKSEALWGFLGLRKYLFYFNNFNMGGKPNEHFERIILKHAVVGSMIICYHPLFMGNRKGYVNVRFRDMYMDGLHFTWRGGGDGKWIRVYFYELLVNEDVDE